MDRIVNVSIGLLFLFALLVPATLTVAPGTLLGADAAAFQPPKTVVAADSLYAMDLPVETADGTRSTLSSLAGKPRIATMFYAHCQSMCLLAVQTLKDLDVTLSPIERQALGYVLLSLDPQRDAPEALRERARMHGLDSDRWFLARTNGADMARAADFLGVSWRTLANGEIDHAAALVLLDAQGRELSRTTTVGTVDGEFVREVRQALRGSTGR
jgi:protein SCO1